MANTEGLTQKTRRKSEKKMQLRKIEISSMKKMRDRIHATPLYKHPSAFMWQQSLSINNQFCDAVVSAGYLSYEQMLSASCRYCIGASKLGGVIFWQIDHEGKIHDGKIMYYQPDCHRCKDRKPTWVSYLLTKRNGTPRGTSTHCFFGLHLLTEDGISKMEDEKNNYQLSIVNCQFDATIALVEAEKSAVILSELYPEYIWLAAGGLSEVQPEKFRPLKGRKVILFPDTDPNGIAFKRWSEAAKEVMQSIFWEDSPPIRVSPILEINATPEQKQRKIDLVDFLFEGQALSKGSRSLRVQEVQELWPTANGQ